MKQRTYTLNNEKEIQRAERFKSKLENEGLIVTTTIYDFSTPKIVIKGE